MDAILTFILGFLSAFALMMVVSIIVRKTNIDYEEEQWPMHEQGQEGAE